MKKNMFPIFLAFLAALASLGGAVYQYYEKQEANRKAEESKKKAEDFNAKLIKSQADMIIEQQKNNDANVKIISLTEQLNSKALNIIDENKKVKETQKETIKLILGDSYPVLYFHFDKTDSFKMALRNSSTYPIYDLRLIIENYDQIKECKKDIAGNNITINYDCYDKATINKGPYFLAPGSTQKVEFNFPDAKEIINFRFQTVARNKIIIYYCLLKVENNKVLSCYKIYELKNNTLELINQVENGLQIPNQDYFRDNFYVGKNVMTAPI